MSEVDVQTNTETPASETPEPTNAELTANADPVADEAQAQGGETGTVEPTAEASAEDAGEETATGAPEVYEAWSLPEGVQVDEGRQERFNEFAKSMDLSQADAQKLIDFQLAEQGIAAQDVLEAYQAQTESWREQTLSMPEFAGKEGEANLAIANKAIKELGTDELREMLQPYSEENPNGLGLGNNPAFVKFFLGLGQKIGDDGIVHADGDARSNMSREEIMYG